MVEARALAEAVTKGVLTHVEVSVKPGSGLVLDVDVPRADRVKDIVRSLVTPITGMYQVRVRITNARAEPEAANKKCLATGTFTALGKALMDAFFPGRGTEAVNKALLRVPITSEEAYRGKRFDRVYDPRKKRWIPARPGMMCRTKDGMICAVTDDPDGIAPPAAAEKDAKLATVLCDTLFDMLLAEKPPTVRG
ncbi:hypothetical protein [Methanopyrus kandleri]|uniref:Uncharacterized protein n=2 Tax=Methanopyrus kandleri TaxID=2320 RepID=Q8TZ18_METKA|nr:hypothetical protein [Methanopyrus kandleri]AAM01340.1 Uncharacterized protein MK0123 [Methanopyrus kandleri AV19]HII70737.1 hypothetical protein [Methanopyrus kandleri]